MEKAQHFFAFVLVNNSVNGAWLHVVCYARMRLCHDNRNKFSIICSKHSLKKYLHFSDTWEVVSGCHASGTVTSVVDHREAQATLFVPLQIHILAYIVHFCCIFLLFSLRPYFIASSIGCLNDTHEFNFFFFKKAAKYLLLLFLRDG